MIGQGTNSFELGLLMQCPGDLHLFVRPFCLPFCLLMTTAMPFTVQKYPVSNAWCTAGKVGLQILVALRCCSCLPTWCAAARQRSNWVGLLGVLTLHDSLGINVRHQYICQVYAMQP